MRDAVLSLSLANLCLLAAWDHLLDPPFKGYHLEEAPAAVNYLSVPLCVLLLAALFWSAHAFARRRPRFTRVVRWGFFVTTLIVLNNIRILMLGPFTARTVTTAIGRGGLLLAIILPLGLLALAIRFFPRRMIGATRALVFILSPFVLVTFSQALRGIIRSVPPKQAARSDERSGGRAARPSARVVWIILDELDYRVAFEARPSSVELPELDRLRRESIFATDARPPAGLTLLSMPALINGREVTEARETGPATLTLKFAGSDSSARWGEQPNIFSRARLLGGRTGLVGWYHPYCRILGGDLTKCSWETSDTEMDRYGRGLLASLRDDTRRAALTVPLLRDVLSRFRERRREDDWKQRQFDFLARLRGRATEMAADRELDLVMLHYPVPHPPGMYDRRQDRLSFEGTNYFDNLELADQLLGDVRRALERAGLWDKTVLLVSSDHWWRTELWRREYTWTEEEAQSLLAAGHADHRVPFILKLRGQQRGVEYSGTFRTVASHDLLLALLRGEVTEVRNALEWFEAHRAVGPG